MSNPFDRNPFRLPPPWNAGYALPQNVDDEGLERHAYTTAWAPRGSFDDPKVGDAGYAVPAYVKEEGYGVGAMTTRWAPRGSYAGPKVVHWLDKQSAQVVGRKPLPGGATQLQIKALAGTEASATGGPAPLTSYGMKTSAALIDAVKMMPPDLRDSQLKKALDRVDPKLYAAGGALASADAKAGLQPTVALQRGLAVAMTKGMANELVGLGKGKAPPKKTQLGAVCSRMGLGEDPVRAGFCWIPATATVPGHWERMRAGQTACANAAPAGSTAPTVRDHTAGGGSAGGVTVTDSSGNVVKTPPPRPAPPPEPASDQKFVQIGPFLIPTNVGAYRDHRTLTDEKKAYVDQNIAIAAKSGGVSIAEMKTGKYPFVKFKSPNGEDWGLFYQESDGTQKTSRGTTIPAGTVVSYHKIAPTMLGNILGDAWDSVKDAAEWVGGAIASVFKKIWAGIKWVAAKVVDFVKEAVEFVKDAACKVFSSPVGQLAGAAAGAYVGGPAGAQAGAAGAQLIAQSCADAPATPPQLPAPPPENNLMPLLLIGGAGIAAYFLLGGKKKGHH